MNARNRLLELLRSGATLNGIDYVEVREAEPTRLYVHFVNTVVIANPLLVATITGGDLMPDVAVAPIQAADWSQDSEGRPILRLTVQGRGDHSAYLLRFTGGAALDPYFSEMRFSFFAFCPSAVDCLGPAELCPADDDPVPVIDYLAKDYQSFRQALSDFSSQRYPEWRERAETDFGMVMLEALSALGDELSYIQDRGHLQARIDTATERDALVRLARLVDYEPAPVISARTMLQCDVTGSVVPAGILVTALAPDGSAIPFETGTGIRDATNYQVSPKWNAGVQPYWWDDEDRCLRAGATSMYVTGDGFGFFQGQRLLIDTEGPSTADPHLRQQVTLVDPIEELSDPLFSQKITRITWRPEDALVAHHDLTRTIVAGNLVPATQGIRHSEVFAIRQRPPGNPHMPLAVARLGPNSTAASPNWLYRFTLSSNPLAYLRLDDGSLRPEVVVTRLGPQPREWTWRRSLLEAGEFDEAFTVDPGSWRRIADLESGEASDYDGSEGATLRFGDTVFGERPGDADVFEVRHRATRGAIGRVPADAVTRVDPAWVGVLVSATNPFPAVDGLDAETDEQIRQRAPEDFRVRTFRAVRPEDYNAAAATLTWVERAGTVFRWTGSWTTIFVTADPRNAGAIAPDQHLSLSHLLNRYRLAGYEVYAPAPRYVSFDLQIVVCAQATAFRGDVDAGIDRALRPVRYPDRKIGFFHFDNFTLGTPFERSRLEAAIQEIPGVAGVLSIQYRRRGQTAGFSELPPLVAFGTGEIFRMDNDMNHPERGSYRIRVEGGK
jgi:hypothetical protein